MEHPKTTIYFLAILIGLFTASSASAAITIHPALNLGLVGYWSMDEGSGGIAGDFSGNGNDGVILSRVASDNFNRANANPISGSWAIAPQMTNNLQIVSNQATGISASGANNGAYYTGATFANDQYVKFTLGTGENSYVSALLRVNTTDGSGYGIGIRHGTSGYIIIDRLTAGGSSQPYMLNGDYANSGDTFEARVVGNTLYAYINGTLITSYTDPSPLSGNRTGAFARHSSVTLDNWEAGNISGTWVDGKRGKALEFDGSTNEVVAGDSPSLEISGSTITLSAWFKASSVSATTSLLAKGSYGLYWNYGFGIGGAHLYARHDDMDLVSTAVTVTANVWHNYTLVYSGGNDYFYYDGVLVDTKSDNGWSEPTENNQLTIGAAYTNGTNSYSELFNGLIDEVRIYNRSLSATEVASIYNSGSAKFSASNNTGLVGYWSMEEGSGTQVGDMSGTRNNGIASGSPLWVNGKRGKALSFDGTNDYVDMANPVSLNLNTNFTISAWVKVNDFGTSIGGIVAEGTNSTVVIRADGNSGNCTTGSCFTFRLNDGVDNIEGSVDAATDRWYHLTMVVGARGSGGLRGYVDEVEVVTLDTSSIGDVTSTDNWYIGYNERNLNYFNGIIDEVRIYNRALSATEVAKLYSSSKKIIKYNTSQNNKLTTGLVGLWSFNGSDIAGAVAYDRSGTGNNGTISGATIINGKVGQALTFNGSSNSIDLGDVYNGVKSVTFWVKTSDVSDNGYFDGLLDEIRFYSTTLSSAEVKRLYNLGASGSSPLPLSSVDPSTKMLALNSTTGIKIVSGTVTASGFSTPTIYVDGTAGTAIDDNWRFVAITTDTAINATSSTLGLGSSSWGCGDTKVYNNDIYTTVQMSATYGSQCWFQENLRTIFKPDGVTSITSYCHDSGCGSPWGRLYNWTTMMNGSTTATGCGAKIQGICPSGWHIPSAYTSCPNDDFAALGTDGGALKQAGTANWSSPNTGATNASNWTGYPAGTWDNGFYSRGTHADFWSSAQSDGTYAKYRYLDYDNAGWGSGSNYKTYGWSVRCVKD